MKVLALKHGPDGIFLYRAENQLAGLDYTVAPLENWLDTAVATLPDVVYLGYCGAPETLAELCALRERHGIPFVVDCDDLFTHVPEYNQSVNVVHPASPGYKIRKAMLREADAVTVSTSTLATLLKRDVGVDATVVPNFVKPEWFDAPRRRKPAGQVRVAFSGASGGRWGDMEMIRPVIEEVARDKRVAVGLFGTFPAWALEIHNIHAIRWSSPPMYFQLLRHLNFDIGLAPLLPNEFNRCKSAIKYYEYAMVGAAGVYSALEPYTEVVDGVTGLVIEPDEHCWLDAIDRLVTDVDARRQICDNAYADVCESHTSSDALSAVLREVTDDSNRKLVTTEAEAGASTGQCGGP